jgi:alpha-galactosidase
MESESTPSSRIPSPSARRCSLLGFSILLALPVFAYSGAQAAPGLNGAWRIDIAKPSGVTVHTILVLHQEGGKVTGTVFPNSSGASEVEGAHMDGADIVFTMNWAWNFRVRPEGANLRVVITYGGGGRDEALAVPVPENNLWPTEAAPLPAIRDLPDNGMARTPPMGWNSWNHFAEAIDDRIIRETADAMVASGMAAAGYVYVNIDDTWEGGRDTQGNIMPNRKFPDMRALADYVHRKGLKFGIYSSPGPVTCGGYEGSYGHEEQDARTFAAWGVDYLKYDWCSAARIYTSSQMRPIFQRMGEALGGCGRAMVFSISGYGSGIGDIWTWGPRAGGNLWRTMGDIQDNWRRMSEIGFSQDRFAPYAGPGHWNDPDMLEVGNGGMSATEYRTHFSLWCLLAAPLMAGNDLRAMSAETLGILTNREAIAVDQDALGRQGTRLSARDGVEIWEKPLGGGGRALGLFNRGDAQVAASVAWAEAGLSSRPSSERDLWGHSDIAPADGGISAIIPAHGVVMLVVR